MGSKMANFDRGLTHTHVNLLEPYWSWYVLRRNSLSFLLKEAEEDKPVVVEFSEL